MSEQKQDRGTRVSRQEELLYGHYAGFVRRSGQLAVIAEEAESELSALRRASAEADQIEMGKVAPARGMDEQGRSPETRWLDVQLDAFNEVVGLLNATHLRVAEEFLARWQAWRRGPDDGQWDDGEQPSVFGTEETASMLRQLASYGGANLSPSQVSRACEIADSLDPSRAGWRPGQEGHPVFWEVERSNPLTEEEVRKILAANPTYEVVGIAVSHEDLAVVARTMVEDARLVHVDPGLAARIAPGVYSQLWRVQMINRRSA